MTSFLLNFSAKHGNHKQSIIFLLVVVVFVVPSGSTIVDYIIPVAHLASAQQKDNDNDINNAERNREILWVDVKDFISSGTAEDISVAIQSTSPAARSSSLSSFSAIILALDTPGGSLDATFDIIDAIQQSPVPVIGYVYPKGKSAWSAGTIILLATDYAAMAPVTTTGSAQPVRGTEPVNDTKVVNAVAEKAVSLAELHERNVTQAARFVTHNDNLTPEKAMNRNVIEALAASPEELLAIADGVTVNTFSGAKVLYTADAQIIRYESSLRTQLINFFSNPLIATTFMTIGFFVLIYGITSPGFGVEIAGAILIILGLLGQGLGGKLGCSCSVSIGNRASSLRTVQPRIWSSRDRWHSSSGYWRCVYDHSASKTSSSHRRAYWKLGSYIYNYNSPFCRPYGPDNIQGMEGKEEKAQAVCYSK